MGTKCEHSQENSMATSTGYLIVWLGVIGLSFGQSEYRPPHQDKFYRAGEPTTIFTPGDTSYTTAWYLMEHRSSFIFRVKSCYGAYLVLSPNIAGSPDENSTEILLGEDDNTMSYMRRFSSSTYDFQTYTPEYLHCNELRSFWVRWVGGRSSRIEVGRGPNVGEQKFMDWTNEHHQSVHGVGLTGAMYSAATWEVNENTGEQLDVLTHDEHKYEHMWKSIHDRYYWTFNVMACGHVHIVLTSEMGRTDVNVVEIVIGGWDNTVSVIRTEVRGPLESELARDDTPDILSCTQTREFWISWMHGMVQLGRGALYGRHHILKASEPIGHRDNVRYLGISTGFGATGTWFIEDDTQTFSHVFTPYVGTSADVMARYNTTWIESPRKEYFKFGVVACAEAHVHLSQYDAVDPEFGYEIIIGAEDNSKIVLQYPDWIGYIREVPMSGVLDCEQPRNFWVEWDGRRLRLGYGSVYGQQELWEPFELPEDYRIRALALSTVGHTGHWRLRETSGEYLVYDTPPEYQTFEHVWRSMRDKKFFIFQVKACSDAHVALSPVPGIDSSDWYYDLVIGGWDNQWTILRKRRGEENQDASGQFETPDLLNCDAFVDLWVSWYDNMLEAGTGPHPKRHTFFNHALDDGVLPIKAVAISSGWGKNAKWRMEEDNGDQITYYTGSKYDIDQFWYRISSWITWYNFLARSCNDAIIYLSQEGTWASDNAVEIVIGTSSNTRSQIRRASDKHVYKEEDSPGILSCTDYRQFWASWGAGLIRMGTGGLNGINTVIEYDLQDDTAMHGISMTEGDLTDEQTGRWRVAQSSGYRTYFATSDVYGYEQVWKSVEHSHHIVFGVTACSDVHVALSERITYHYDHAYEVVLGGWDNTKSVIREGGRWDKDYATVDHPDSGMVSCTEHHHFWIEWRNGAIVVGMGQQPGNPDQRLMDYHPLAAYDIRHIGFTTGTGASGNWSLQLNEEYYEDEPVGEENPGGSGGLSAGEIVGIVFGCLAVVLLIMLVVMVVIDRRGWKDCNWWSKQSDQTPLA